VQIHPIARSYCVSHSSSLRHHQKAWFHEASNPRPIVVEELFVIGGGRFVEASVIALAVKSGSRSHEAANELVKSKLKQLVLNAFTTFVLDR